MQKELIDDAYLYVIRMLMTVKAWICGRLCTLRTKGASHFVEILVAIIIVIAVGAIFKNQIISFINTITGQATTKATGLF